MRKNFYDRPQGLLEKRILVRRRGRVFFRKSLALAMMAVLLGGAEVFSQPIKLGYAALSAGQVVAWMAKEGGYLSKYGIEAELIYIPAPPPRR